MHISKQTVIDKECSEKGRLWSDYITQLSHALQMGHIPISKLLVSFDVLIAMMHYAMDQADKREFCLFRKDTGEPADFDSIPDTERYYYFTSNDRIEVIVDLFAHPDTVEFV